MKYCNSTPARVSSLFLYTINYVFIPIETVNVAMACIQFFYMFRQLVCKNCRQMCLFLAMLAVIEDVPTTAEMKSDIRC